MPEMESFALRLKQLIKGQSLSAFARQVGLGESLLRSYLKGTEPSLSKAMQISQGTGTSLQWLATGLGDPTDQLFLWKQTLKTHMSISEAEWHRLEQKFLSEARLVEDLTPPATDEK